MFYFLRTCWWRGPAAFHCAWQNIHSPSQQVFTLWSIEKPCSSLASVNNNLQVNKRNAPSPQRRSCEKAGQRYQHPILNRFSGANEHGKSRVEASQSWTMVINPQQVCFGAQLRRLVLITHFQDAKVWENLQVAQRKIWATALLCLHIILLWKKLKVPV